MTFFLLFFLSLVLEGSLFSIPFVFLFLLFSALKFRGVWIFPLAFVAGVLLDAFYIRNIGTTSIFFLIFTFAIFLYQRKFEIESLSFVVITSFVGSLIYFSLLGNVFALQKALITTVFAFIIFRFFLKPNIYG